VILFGFVIAAAVIAFLLLLLVFYYHSLDFFYSLLSLLATFLLCCTWGYGKQENGFAFAFALLERPTEGGKKSASGFPLL